MLWGHECTDKSVSDFNSQSAGLQSKLFKFITFMTAALKDIADERLWIFFLHYSKLLILQLQV